MNKLTLTLSSALVISTLSLSYLAFAQSTNITRPPIDNGITTTTNTDPNSLENPVLYNPAILSGPSTTVTPVEQPAEQPVEQPAEQPVEQPANNGATDTTDTTITVTPTKPVITRPTPTTTRPAIPTTPKQPIEASNCPTINPIEPNQTECPKVETHNIVPVLPYFTFGGAIGMVILFWILMSILGHSQSKTETRFAAKHLANEHQKTVASDRQSTYMDLMDFATKELSSDSLFDQKTFNQINSKISLLGSTEMQKISTSLGEAMRTDNRNEMKTQLKLLSHRLKLEL